MALAHELAEQSELLARRRGRQELSEGGDSVVLVDRVGGAAAQRVGRGGIDGGGVDERGVDRSAIQRGDVHAIGVEVRVGAGDRPADERADAVLDGHAVGDEQ